MTHHFQRPTPFPFMPIISPQTSWSSSPVADFSMASSIPAHLLLFLSLLPFFVSAQINIGSSLLAGDPSSPPWRSPSGDFSFGFQKLANHGDLFLLAVWFSNTPENTIVWYPKLKNNDPIIAPRGSKLELTAADGLLLRNARGQETWRSELSSGTVSSAVMNDSGNLMLVVDSDRKPIWESFRIPTDTLLPTQVMLINDALSSRRSKESFSHGRFQFRMLEDGNAVLNTVNLPTNFPYDAYYVSGTRNDADLFRSGYSVVFGEDGSLYVLKRSGERVQITNPPSGFPSTAYYFRATLNFDGVLTVSCHPKSPEAAINGSWKDVAAIPDNICTAARGVLGTGACGFNSICRLNPDRRPSCQCPPGYSLIDPKDEYGSCKPNFTQSCEENSSGAGAGGMYSMTELRNTDWPMLDYELYSPLGAEDCKNGCLSDCLCVVSVYRDNSCWKKKLPLSNGREDPSETSVSFLKLRQKMAP